MLKFVDVFETVFFNEIPHRSIVGKCNIGIKVIRIITMMHRNWIAWHHNRGHDDWVKIYKSVLFPIHGHTCNITSIDNYIFSVVSLKCDFLTINTTDLIYVCEIMKIVGANFCFVHKPHNVFYFKIEHTTCINENSRVASEGRPYRAMLALQPQRMPVTTTQEFSTGFRLAPVVFSINWSFSDRRYYSFYKITQFI